MKGNTDIINTHGNDTITSIGTNNTVNGAHDVVYATGSVIVNSSNNIIYGKGTGHDTITANSTGDIVYANTVSAAGADLLVANGKNDTLVSGTAHAINSHYNVVMWGASSKDLVTDFIYRGGNIIIHNFHDAASGGHDILEISKAVDSNTAAHIIHYNISYSNGNADIGIAGVGHITLAGISSGLSTSDIHMV